MRNFFLAIAALFLLSACAAQPTSVAPEIDFSGAQKINFNVEKIEVIEAYRSPMRSPNVEHIMPISPADGVQIWAKDRLRATGGAQASGKILQVTINEASVVETGLPKTQGIKGLFTVDQDKKYDADLEVELRIYGGGSLSEADASANVTRSITLPENASVTSRKAAYKQMVFDLMTTLNDKLEQNIRSYMSNYTHF